MVDGERKKVKCSNEEQNDRDDPVGRGRRGYGRGNGQHHVRLRHGKRDDGDKHHGVAAPGTRIGTKLSRFENLI